MTTVIIGSGNIATIFGEKISAAGHPVTQIVARNPTRATALAQSLNCDWTSRYADVDQTAELYIVALSDNALENLGSELTLPGKLVVHTSGAAPLALLRAVTERCGVIWPLQSIRAAVRPIPPMPLLIDAADPRDSITLETFAKSLSAQVQYADDATRLKLHLAAVLTNNFTNYLYTLAAGYCQKESLDFSLLLPLIRETANRLDRYPPETTQTGPAARGDWNTIARHLNELDNYKNIRQLYELLTIQIEERYHHERIGKI
jgi:predicted short-subunit dehydrogenase-like oxidoreductase (DUF2520 family)